MRILNKFILAALVLVYVPFFGFAQDGNDWKYQLPKECWDAMVGGKTQIVSKYFAPSVELSLPGGSGLYSNKQATVVLEEFMAQGVFHKAEVDNERQTGKSTMMIATAEIKGRSYRVYVLTQQSQNGCQIQKLRIEEEK